MNITGDISLHICRYIYISEAGAHHDINTIILDEEEAHDSPCGKKF